MWCGRVEDKITRISGSKARGVGGSLREVVAACGRWWQLGGGKEIRSQGF
jgi:hypothetical protein